MKPLRPLVVLLSILFVVILMIPTLLVIPFHDKTQGELGENLQPKETPAKKAPQNQIAVEVAVYRNQLKKIETPLLEDYVAGVVAAEMPADFELEALKAQALTARTYIVKQMIKKQNIADLPKGAVVSDTQMHQVFLNDQELQKKWKSDYTWKMKKIKEAVQATQGQILTFENNPIEAQFFSTSNGFTENSEDYWANSLPYLRSVESPWDEASPKFLNQITLPVTVFEKKLGVNLGSNGSVGTVLARTDGKRIEQIEISGKKFTGREIREKLDLKSSDFTWKRIEDKIVITTKGYGHGVGMSQYGANGMAKEGKNYKDIVTHYYKGVEIASAETFLTGFMAKN